MFNEMPTTPVHPSYFLAEEQQKKKGGRNQYDTLNKIKYDDCDDKEHIILISNTYQISQRFNI